MCSFYGPNPKNGFPCWYRLVCPELNQAKHVGCRREYDCDTTRLFEKKDESWFYDTFVRPLSDAQRIQHFRPPAGGLFERLPNETIDQILDHVLPADCSDSNLRVKYPRHEGYDVDAVKRLVELSLDGLALGLSCARLWPLVLRRIYRLYQQHSWVDRKIGFHRRNSRFTEAQLRNYGIESPSETYLASVGDWRWDWSMSGLDGRWLCLTHASHGFSSERALKMCKYEMETRPDDLVKIRLDLMARPNPDAASGLKVWVLRNLTTGQYIRSDRLQDPGSDTAPDWGAGPKAYELLSDKMRRVSKSLTQRILRKPKKSSKPVQREIGEQFTLANVFLVLTCSGGNGVLDSASEDPYAREKYLDFIHGPWAGCAFEVLTLDDHVQSQQLPPLPNSNIQQPNYAWVNVSRDVISDIANLRQCVRRMKAMRNYDHELYLSRDNLTAYTVYWDDFWTKVAQMRKLHRKWVEKCPPRPWIDEKMCAST